MTPRLALLLALCPATAAGDAPSPLDGPLRRAGDNRRQLETALDKVPPARRPAMVFLVAHMPESDLRTLKADFLLENVRLAYEARGKTPWGRKISESLFFNYVLPYANVNESRDPWRAEFFKLCMPLIQDCKTPGEAAHRLNSTLFKKLNVRYSTRRAKPHQSPKETIAQGMASCTGLSILLVDACRSVGVPARVVGTPSWTNRRGNHTWVEIWDGDWHFTGACEAHPKGLDRGWFQHNASLAKADSRRHGIYAARFRPTGSTFPLVWSPGDRSVPAVNVTDRYVKKVEDRELLPAQLAGLRKAVRGYFAADSAGRANWDFPEQYDQWIAGDEEAVRKAVWDEFRRAPHKAMRAEFDAKKVKNDGRVSPWAVKTVGEKPAGGWALFIAMHGGGNTEQRVNDSQWRIMQRYYRDHPEAGGYKYVALRAPNNTWNGFYAPYVPPLVERLIRQHLLFGGVNPDRVYLMGYSHGGYGAFYIGPKIPYRFAAIHASAAAPTPGTISPLTLRNTRLTFMVGERDTRYGRRERCEAFAKEVAAVKKSSPGAFPVEFEFKKGYGHGGLPDRDKTKEMSRFERNPTPPRLSWKQTDSFVNEFFWLHSGEPKSGNLIEASADREANRVSLKTGGANRLAVYLDGRLVDLDKPLSLNVNGARETVKLKPRLATLCETLAERGDPRLAFCVRLGVAD